MDNLIQNSTCTVIPVSDWELKERTPSNIRDCDATVIVAGDSTCEATMEMLPCGV